MKVKIFLGEYAYIYRGNIDLREMNEYIKTLTPRQYIIKWKDSEDDLITISKKQDLVYFYQQWTQNQTTNRQSFRLYVQEIQQQIQSNQIPQLQSQSQINSKMPSPSQKYSCTRQYQGVTQQFTFGQQMNEQTKSQEIQKERHSIQINLQSIQEIQGSSKNISNQNLDQTQFMYQQNEEGAKMRILQDFNNIPSQDPSSFLNMDMKQSIKKQFADVQMPNDDEDIIDNKEDENDDLLIDSKNIFCDYCSDKILDEVPIIYVCQLCEDFHICKFCYDQNQEQVHLHQLKEIVLQ